MHDVIDISWLRLGAASIYAILIILIVRRLGIPRELQILVSSIRMVVQLIIAGYVLIYLFDTESPLWILLIIAVMESFAVYNAIKRTNTHLSPQLKQIVGVAIVLGTLLALGWFLFVVVGGDAWQDPRYVVPIAGMIIGNAMTGVALGTSRLVEGVRQQRGMIENSLMLGATPRVASRTIVRSAFDAAILPTINAMVGIGIVSLPGMMTGQILAGISPLVAIKYQMAIMLGILGSVGFSVLILVEWGIRTFFNHDAQLVDTDA